MSTYANNVFFFFFVKSLNDEVLYETVIRQSELTKKGSLGTQQRAEQKTGVTRKPLSEEGRVKIPQNRPQ